MARQTGHSGISPELLMRVPELCSVRRLTGRSNS